jgi:hypothetical protein
MSTTTSIHEHAVTIDTALAKTYEDLAKAQYELESIKNNVRRLAGQTYTWRTTKQWSGSYADAVAHTQFNSEWQAKGHADAVYGAQQQLATVEAIWSDANALNGKWIEGGRWSRFYLVCNSNGHIHSSTSCSTCFPTTQYAWLTNLSGLTEADAVEAEGEVLCSVCFPSAPVAWTNGTSRRDKEAKAQRDAEKAERQRKKAEKSLSLDGEVVKIRADKSRSKEFKTLRSAELWLVEAYAHNIASVIPDRCWWFSAPDAYSEENVLHVVELCALKTGKNADDIIADALKKATKKVKEA